MYQLIIVLEDTDFTDYRTTKIDCIISSSVSGRLMTIKC